MKRGQVVSRGATWQTTGGSQVSILRNAVDTRRHVFWSSSTDLPDYNRYLTLRGAHCWSQIQFTDVNSRTQQQFTSLKHNTHYTPLLSRQSRLEFSLPVKRVVYFFFTDRCLTVTFVYRSDVCGCENNVTWVTCVCLLNMLCVCFSGRVGSEVEWVGGREKHLQWAWLELWPSQSTDASSLSRIRCALGERQVLRPAVLAHSPITLCFCRQHEP